MADTETVERIVIVDGFWLRDPNAETSQLASGALATRGTRVRVTQEEAGRYAAYLATEEEYQQSLGQLGDEVLEQASAQSVIPTENPADETISAMTVAEVTAYLGQHSDDAGEVDRVEALENDRDGGPRVTVLKAIEGIRANAPEGVATAESETDNS